MNTLHVLPSAAFSLGQARERGLSRNALNHALGSGGLVRIKRGWYAEPSSPWAVDRYRQLVDVTLRGRTGVVPSHYSALALLGLPLHRPDWSVVHVMRTGHGRPQTRRGLHIHQQVAGYVSVGPALAIAQTALVCQVSALMSLDAALRGRMVSPQAFRDLAPHLAGQRGFAKLAAVHRLADGSRESPLESWAALVFDGLSLDLEPQFEVPRTRYRADARIRGTRVLVECDGESKYEDRHSLYAEKLREDDIRQRGWEVVRVTAGLLEDPTRLGTLVTAALSRSSRRVAA